jgi:hypothetical protein
MFEKLRSAVSGTIDRAYAVALDLLGQNRRTLDALAAALFVAGYLDRAEIEAVLAKTPLLTTASTDGPAVQDSQQPDSEPGETDAAITQTLPSDRAPTIEV